MRRPTPTVITPDADPFWFKDAIIYQVHVRAFQDANGDGIGDFPGLTSRLDYLRELGITAIWLLPFYPSPLRDDGYDISDYNGVHPSYGTLADFRHFLREAHARGLRVITELVVNHTSDQHPWFQRARRAARGSAWRDFYVWSDSTDRYRDARIIFKDFETSNWTWDPVAGAYFWHRFYSHQPDLNYDNPEVRRAVTRAMDHWFQMGVDGLRLDAVPYLHEAEGTSCENLEATHEELRRLRRHVDERHEARMLLAEANQWPEDAVAYFGRGDECHMAFHFPLMPRMFMAVRMEDRYPIIDILNQTPAIPESCQWALFLRNHDELTLEMVTDEERDYMYRVYAADPQARINLGIRRRLAPLLGNDRRRIELLNGLLFSLPGTPIVYYGDELGMGDNIYLGDRNGVRTPMQWSPDRNAGFSRANPQKLYAPVIIDPDFNYETVNVETQHDNQHSLLWWMQRLIALRKRYRAFGRGTLTFLHPENRTVLAFVRAWEDERVLVVANLSRHAQAVELDLGAYDGLRPIEAFGRHPFPAITTAPYPLTLAPHGFYWLSLEAARGPVEVRPEAATEGPRRLSIAPRFEALLTGRGRTAFEAVLPDFVATRRWFGAKARGPAEITILDAFPLRAGDQEYRILTIEIEYADGDPDTYVLTLGLRTGEAADELLAREPHRVIARLGGRDESAVVYSALSDPGFGAALLETIARRKHLKGRTAEIVGRPTTLLRAALTGAPALDARPVGAEQSNSSLVYGRSLVLKLFRRIEAGPHPEVEIGTFLTERAGFVHTAPVCGTLEIVPRRGTGSVLAVVLGFVPNEGDAWRLTLDSVSRAAERFLARGAAEAPAGPAHPLEAMLDAGAPAAPGPLGPYEASASLLGQRVAELHLALISRPEEPDFAPEPFNPTYRRALYQSMRNLVEEVFDTLRRRLRDLPEASRAPARALLDRRAEILGRMRRIADRKIAALRTRHHGDLHLGQILWTGRDFTIIDFEGEPSRALSTRRLKRSPLRDVAGMLRSFHYAAHHGLADLVVRGVARREDADRLAGWADDWSIAAGRVFLAAYLAKVDAAGFMPRDADELRILLEGFLLEKAVYELGYELNNRPDWVSLPLRGLTRLLGPTADEDDEDEGDDRRT
ncbi:MAG: maltose alpha-D-glucosyltransferase [Vicinamibacterales bacterium]